MSLPYDLSKTGRVASIFLLVYCATEVLFAWHSYSLFGFYDAVEFGLMSPAEIDAEAARIDGIGLMVAVVFLTALIGSYIASGMWIYRAASNAQAVTPNPDAITPGWAVGWFFVPFANLVMPYKAIRQAWEGLAGPNGPNWPSWAIIWWLLWVVMTLVTGVSNRINFGAETMNDFRLGTTFDIVSSVMAIPTAILFRKLILEMTALGADARPAPTLDLEEGHS